MLISSQIQPCLLKQSLNTQKLLLFGDKMAMFINVGYVWQILEGGSFLPHPSVSSLEKAHLNRVNGLDTSTSNLYLYMPLQSAKSVIKDYQMYWKVVHASSISKKCYKGLPNVLEGYWWKNSIKGMREIDR